MNEYDAIQEAKRMRALPGVLKAEVVRILPAHVDPPKGQGDNGWDVQITVEGDQ